MKWFQNTKVANKNYFLIALIVALLLGTWFIQRNELKKIEGSWIHYQNEVVERKNLLAAIENNFGYGGFIHNFKNYVLRGAEKYVNRFEKNKIAVYRYLKSYQKIDGLSEKEKNALENIKKVAKEYEKNMGIVTTLIKEGKSIKEIDSIVKVNDDPAFKAFKDLESEFNRIQKRDTKELIASKNEAVIYLLISFSVVIVLIILFNLLFFAPSITKPLKQFFKKFTIGTTGDLTVRVELSSKDEIGILGKHFDEFLASLNEIVKKIKDRMNSLLFNAEDMSSNSQQSATNLREITASVQSVAQSMESQKNMVAESNNFLKQVTHGFQEIASQSEEIKDQIVQASTAVEQMAATINSSTSLAQKGDSAANKLTEVAEEGFKAMQTLSQSIQVVSSSSDKIVEMVQLIMDISEQTNLLAMNAAIEAAHAGEFGKGFAVVAEEIRKLADKSGDGAKQIQEVVKDISSEIQENLKLAGQTQQNFDVLKTNVVGVNQINHEIASAMEEQRDANQSILKVVEVLQKMGSSIVERTNEESQRVKNVEQKLANLSVISEEVASAVDEEKIALSEASSASDHISNISNQIKELSIEVKEDFSKFKVS